MSCQTLYRNVASVPDAQRIWQQAARKCKGLSASHCETSSQLGRAKWQWCSLEQGMMRASKQGEVPVMENPAPLREGTLMKLLLGSVANALGKLDSFSCRETTTSQLPECLHATPTHPKQVSESCCGNWDPDPVLHVWIYEHTRECICYWQVEAVLVAHRSHLHLMQLIIAVCPIRHRI